MLPRGSDKEKPMKCPFSPLRIKIPWLLDMVVVSDPEQIKKIEASGDVDRLHVNGTAALPWWIRFFFRATKFYDDERDQWFCPFESASDPTYKPRRAYLEGKVASGYSQEDIHQIADLLLANVDDESLGHAMVQVVNRRFFGKEIPLPVTRAAKNTLQNFSEAVFPWKYRRARQSRKEILDFCAANAETGVQLLDVGHNIGEVVQATVGALRQLLAKLDRPIAETFTNYAPTPQVPRIAIRRSRLDGLLWWPTRPGKTVVIFKNGKAAAKTLDLLFTFGTGRSERSCVFMDFFMRFMGDLQKELLQKRASGRGPGAA
jgi:hypothetical protein